MWRDLITNLSIYNEHYLDIPNIFQRFKTFSRYTEHFQICRSFFRYTKHIVTEKEVLTFSMLSRFRALSVGFQRENPRVISFQVHNQGIITVPIDFDCLLLNLTLNTLPSLTHSITPSLGFEWCDSGCRCTQYYLLILGDGGVFIGLETNQERWNSQNRDVAICNIVLNIHSKDVVVLG